MAYLKKIQRKKGIVYQIVYSLRGVQHKSPTLSNISEREALLLKKQIENDIGLHKAGLKVFRDPFQKAHIETISSFKEWFFENKKLAVNKGTKIKDRTMETYDRAFNFLVDCIGDISLSRINNSAIRKIEDKLTKYAATTSSILIRSLRQAWNFGIQKGRIDHNPFREISILKDKDAPLPDVFSYEEMDWIMFHIRSITVLLGAILLRWGGLRRKETCNNIKWNNIDFSRDEIRIPDGKIKDNRRIPLHPKLKKILSIYIREYEKDHGEKPVGYIVKYNEHTFTSKLRDAKIAAGIKKKGSVHIFRHSAATHALEQEADLMEVKDFLGHTKISTTARYIHLTSKHIQKKFKDFKF